MGVISLVAPFSIFSEEASEEDVFTLDTYVVDMDLEDMLNIDNDQKENLELDFYGYLRVNVENVFDIPSVDGEGNTVKNSDPLEWSSPSFHLFGITKINSDLHALFNVFAEDGDFDLRNAWGNYKFNDGFQLRFGKQYRRFGLFNEKLDQSPVFVGIEPPELLDQDHLLLPRTTRFTLHGDKDLGDGVFSYSLSTDNGEAGAEESVFPLSMDFRFKTDKFLVGASGYLSSVGSGSTSSTVALGEGSPRGGVLPWMEGDQYEVFGLFYEGVMDRWVVQTAFWNASHDAIRNPESVLEVVRNAGINDVQRARFLGVNASKANADLSISDVVRSANYDVKTAYMRVGYRISTQHGSWVPYFHWDWMDNPEVVASKTWGGDNEAGFADDGKFTKYSMGLVYKPKDELAFKLDVSMHSNEFNGRKESYPEIRFDVSLAFK